MAGAPIVDVYNLLARTAAIASIGAVVVVASSACYPDGQGCSPGDYVSCTCPNGAAGGALCVTNGSGYGDCDCTILLEGGALTTADDAGVLTDGAPDAQSSDPCAAPANRPQSCACTDASQCAGGVCHDYGAKGVRCTKPCAQNADCPPPATKCSPMSMVCNTP